MSTPHIRILWVYIVTYPYWHYQDFQDAQAGRFDSHVHAWVKHLCHIAWYHKQVANFEKRKQGSITFRFRCYECGKQTNYLFEDARCGFCTRLTSEEITGIPSGSCPRSGGVFNSSAGSDRLAQSVDPIQSKYSG